MGVIDIFSGYNRPKNVAHFDSAFIVSQQRLYHIFSKLNMLQVPTEDTCGCLIHFIWI